MGARTYHEVCLDSATYDLTFLLVGLVRKCDCICVEGLLVRNTTTNMQLINYICMKISVRVFKFQVRHFRREYN